MRPSKLVLGAASLLSLVAVPATSYAGWVSRTSTSSEVPSTQGLTRVAPLSENYRLPTRTDRVQGMAPSYPVGTSSYVPAPMVAEAADPVYFRTVNGPGNR